MLPALDLPVVKQGDSDVVIYGFIVQQGEVLHNIAERGISESAAPPVAHVQDFLSVHGDASGIRLQNQTDNVQKCGLAAAGRSDNGDGFAAFHGKIGVIYRFYGVVAGFIALAGLCNGDSRHSSFPP